LDAGWVGLRSVQRCYGRFAALTWPQNRVDSIAAESFRDAPYRIAAWDHAEVDIIENRNVNF
jgi:hypothetical protein